MITTIRCYSSLSLHYCRLTNLLRNSQIITKDYGGAGCSIRGLSFSGPPLCSVNKRILEPSNKLKHPKTVSCSQPVDCIEQQKPSRPVRPGSDVCSPKAPFTPICPPLDDTRGFTPPPPPGSGKDCEDGKDKWIKWLLAAIAAGCIGLAAYSWNQKRSESDKSGGKQSSRKQQRIPISSDDIPKKVPYLLIGGGTASFSAFRAIKSLDPKAKVLLISNEYHKPYMRPPLSKELWFHGELGTTPENYRFKQWNGASRSLYYEPDEFYIDPTKLMENPNGGVAVCEGYEVKKVDFCNQSVVLTDGTIINYDQCLIATGCEPKSLDVFQSASRNVKERVSQYRTPEDFEYLKKIVEEKKSLVIIGSGFLGSELSCALAKYVSKIDKPVKIYQIFHESGNIAQALPEYLSIWTTKKIKEQGVCVIPQASVMDVNMMHNHLKLDLSNGQSILTDHVVVCMGNEPNTQLAASSGLAVDKKIGGVVVNSEMKAKKHLYVAGDLASFEDPLLGRRRIESHDHAVISGRLAGENMAGNQKSYTHQAMFWSDLGPNIGFEGIGIIDSSLPTVGVFAKMKPEELEKVRHTSFKDDGSPVEETIGNIGGKSSNKSDNTSEKESIDIKNTIKSNNDSEDFEKGVIFYLRDDKVVGILLWNLFNRISIARRVINENKKFDDLNEVAKLFEIHS